MMRGGVLVMVGRLFVVFRDFRCVRHDSFLPVGPSVRASLYAGRRGGGRSWLVMIS
jgi:hypothetical protein